MNLLQPMADCVRLNVPLPWDVLNAQRKLLLSKGTVLKEERQIEALLAYGMYVDDDVDTSGPLITIDRTKSFNPFVDWDQAYQQLGALLGDLSERAAFVQDVGALTSHIQSLLERDTDAAIFIMMQADFPRYPIGHCLQCGVLCALIAEHLDFAESEKTALVAASLTMNISMIELQTVLSKQTSKLTEQQSAEIQSHPARAVARLKSLGVADIDWLQTVEQHHEQEDGGGYPNRIRTLRRSAQILRDVDIYWAMVSRREYRKALPANQVARSLYMAASSPNASAVSLIVKELGIYPPGSYVKLANGETAVVTRRGRKANTPGVSSFRDAKGAAFIEPLHRETSRPPCDIIAAVPSDEILFSINPAKLFGYSGYQLQR